MSGTVKLSKRFYERFGHQSTAELIDWLNAMQTSTYAHINQVIQGHVTQLRSEMQAGFAAQDAKWERRLAEFEARLNRHLIGGILAIAIPLLTLVWESFRR